MSLAVSIAVVLAAYLMGGCMPGYWFVRWRTGRDVREQGSGGTGATNAGRALGRSGFFVVMVLDGLKGAVAVALARWQQQPELWLYAAAVAAIMGHVWPLQLGFRGGKGIATLLGAWLLLAPWALLPCLILAAIVLLILRRFTLAGLCGLSVLPVALACRTVMSVSMCPTPGRRVGCHVRYPNRAPPATMREGRSPH